MNTLIHLIAVLLATWATWYFLDKDNPVVALAIAGVGLLLILWLLQSIIEDISDASSGLRSRRGRGKNPRAER
jgi:diacylglycerol kinase